MICYPYYILFPLLCQGLIKKLFKKYKASATCGGVIFIFSCGRSHNFPFTCCCDHTARAGYSPRKVQVTLLCRNAITHFVHWRLPLFLFLNEVPHGRDINHCRLPPFLVLHPTLVGGLTCTSEYLLSLRFYFSEPYKSYHCTSFFLSPKFLLRCYYSILPRF